MWPSASWCARVSAEVVGADRVSFIPGGCGTCSQRYCANGTAVTDHINPAWPRCDGDQFDQPGQDLVVGVEVVKLLPGGTDQERVAQAGHPSRQVGWLIVGDCRVNPRRRSRRFG
jgi:hypothetical protein